MKTLIKLLLVLFCFPCFGQQNVGQDVLFLQHKEFPVAKMIQTFEQGTPIGNLDWTPGTNLEPVDRVLLKLKPREWRVQLINTTCIRNRNCGPYEIGYGYTVQGFTDALAKNKPKIINHIKTRAMLYCQIFAKYPATKPYISPFLEHNINKKEAWQNGAKAIRAGCEGTGVVPQIVNSPQGTRYFSTPFTENHGDRPPTNSNGVSWDGSEAFQGNVEQWKKNYKNADYALIWTQSFNCRVLNASFIDPRKRTACPTIDNLKQAAMLQKKKITPIIILPNSSGCMGFSSISSPELWKTNSEDTNDIREGKPLYMSSNKGGNYVQAFGITGRHVADLRYYGSYDGGRYRYYSGTGSNLTAVELAEKAAKLSGNEFIFLKNGSICKGPFHPVNRQGFYQ